jgi:hypothetical protein
MGIGEMSPIPSDATGIVKVEVVDLLPERRQDAGVLEEIVEERGGATLLGSDDQS